MTESAQNGRGIDKQRSQSGPSRTGSSAVHHVTAGAPCLAFETRVRVPESGSPGALPMRHA